MKIAISVLFIWGCLSSVSAQEKVRHSVGLGLSAARMDFFMQGNYQVQKNKLELSAGAGAGVIRSIFQGRIFPQATVRGSYFFVDKPAIQFGTTVSLNFAGMRLNASNSNIHFWQQYYAGYCLTAGKRFKLVHILEVGPMFETYYIEPSATRNTVGTIGYSLQVGCRYAL